MSSFNRLLIDADLDPSNVKLVRLHDSLAKGRVHGSPTPYELWDEGDGKFEIYLLLQHKEKFRWASHVSAFVVAPQKKTLFVGIYEVHGYGQTAPGVVDPIWPGKTPEFCYDLKKRIFSLTMMDDWLSSGVR